MKLAKINVKNFRIYKDETFAFSPLTILTGPNSSGKSTLVKALMLLQDNIKAPNYLGRLEFGQSKHSLGNFDGILNDKNQNLNFSIFFDVPRSQFRGANSLELFLEFSKKHSNEGGLSYLEIYAHSSQESKKRLVCSAKEIGDSVLLQIGDFLEHDLYAMYNSIFDKDSVSLFLDKLDFNYLKKGAKKNIEEKIFINKKLSSNNIRELPELNQLLQEKQKVANKYSEDIFFLTKEIQQIEEELKQLVSELEQIEKDDADSESKTRHSIKVQEDVLASLNNRLDRLASEMKINLESVTIQIESLVNDYKSRIESKYKMLSNEIENDFNKYIEDEIEIAIKNYISELEFSEINIRINNNKNESEKVSIGEVLATKFDDWTNNYINNLIYKIDVDLVSVLEKAESDSGVFELLAKEVKIYSDPNIQLSHFFNTKNVLKFNKMLEVISSIFERIFQELPFTPISAMRGFQQRIYQTSQPKYHLEGALKVLLNMQRNPSLFKEQLNFINHWIVEFGIAQEGEQLRASIVEGDYIQGFFTNEAETTKMNIADKGLGISQLIPIIILTAEQLGKGHLLCIEEPGTHLHPDLQAKLIDFMLEAGDKGVHFLIETHSGVFLTALHAKILEKEDIIEKVGLYFKSPDNAEGQEASFKQVEIDHEKGLEDSFVKYWKDFFDPYYIKLLQSVQDAEKELEKVGKDEPTLFVEGLTDKTILSLAMKLFYSDIQNLFVIRSREKAGHLWVKDMLLSWMIAKRKSKAAGIFDYDEAMRSLEIIRNYKEECKNNNVVKNVKSFALKDYKSIYLRELAKGGFRICFGIEALYSTKVLEYASLHGMLDDRYANRYNIKPDSEIQRLLDIGPRDKVFEERFSKELLLILREFKIGGKLKIVKYIESLSEEDQKEALANFQPLLSEVINFFKNDNNE